MGIRLSISNIAWTSKDDQQIYKYMKKSGFEGLEIAPTRIFPEMPYEKKKEASIFAEKLFNEHGISICSLQSIWYGRNEKIFGSEQERQKLVDYTKKAIDFANSIGAGNLVFGCPKNRSIERDEDRTTAIAFFRELGDYAAERETVLAIEANPVIYGTNFINRTSEAIELISKVGSKGFRLNLDFGTIIYNNENVNTFIPFIDLINHIHISEPNLALIEKRKDHKKLMGLLKASEYKGYVSIEMSRCQNIHDILKTIDYIKAL